VFFLDYVGMLFISHDRRSYLRRNWLTLGIVITSFPLLPSILSVVRLARIARLISLLRLIIVVRRGLMALRSSVGRQGFLYMAGVAAFLVVAAGAILSLLEPETVPGGFGEGIWWALVTVTTVGYGDIAPKTIGGRMLAVALMLIGVGLISTLAASIAAYFVGQDGGIDQKRIEERLDRIESLLQRQNGISGGDDNGAGISDGARPEPEDAGNNRSKP
jgi:voltage-gated potassium channel